MDNDKYIKLLQNRAVAIAELEDYRRQVLNEEIDKVGGLRKFCRKYFGDSNKYYSVLQPLSVGKRPLSDKTFSNLMSIINNEEEGENHDR